MKTNLNDDIHARISRAQAAHLRFLHDAMEKCFPTENLRGLLVESHAALLEGNPELQEPRNLKYLTEITESLPHRYAKENDRAKAWSEIIDQLALAGPHVGLLLQRKKDQFRVADAVNELPPETLRSMDKRSGSSPDPGRSDRTKA